MSQHPQKSAFGRLRPTLLLLSLLALPLPATAFEIVFDYEFDTSNFFGSAGSDQRNALEAAASFFEGIITDDLDAIAPAGPNTWTAAFYLPGDTAATGYKTDLTIAADTVLIYVGAEDRGFGGSLGLSGPGGFSGSGTAGFIDTLITRGESGIITPGITGDDTEFAPWGGSSSFNSNAGLNWNFDVASEPGAGQFDFYTTAIHEIGHVLGLSLADSFVAQVNGSDQFIGPEAMASYGGPIDLESAEDLHWCDGTMSTVFGTGESQEAALNPSLPPGERRLYTELDVAALDDLGWDVVPEPGSAVLFLTGLTLLLLRRPCRKSWAA